MVQLFKYQITKNAIEDGRQSDEALRKRTEKEYCIEKRAGETW
jgi:hypothetical protein